MKKYFIKKLFENLCIKGLKFATICGLVAIGTGGLIDGGTWKERKRREESKK